MRSYRVRSVSQCAAQWLAVALGVSVPVSVAADHVLMALFLPAVLIAGRIRQTLAVVRGTPVVAAAAGLFGLLVLGGAWGPGRATDFVHYLGKYKELALVALWTPMFCDSRWRSRAYVALLSTLLVTLAVSYLIAFQLVDRVGGHGGPDNPTVFKNQITHNVLMAYATFLFVLKAGDSTVRWRQWAFGGAALLAAVNVLSMVKGRTGYVVLTVLALYVAFGQMRWRGRLTLLAAMATTLIAATQLSSRFRDRIDLVVEEARAWQPGVGAVSSVGLRLDYYATTLGIVRAHPLVGVGTGGFERAYAEQVKGSPLPASNNPHNQYLLITAQLGVVGLTVFLALLAALWRTARNLPTSFERHAARGLVLVMASGSLFNSLLLDHTEGMLFCWLSAVLAGGYAATARAVSRSEPGDVGRPA